MRILPAFGGLAFLALSAVPALAVITPIDSLHYNFSNGIPLNNERIVTVQGTVTSPDSIFNPTGTDIYIQDATGGVNVFVSGNITYHFSLNDSVQVTGLCKHFNGLTELDSSAIFVSVTHLGTAVLPPEPLVLTCAQAANSYQAGNHEPNESRLIRINDVHLTAGSWPAAPSTVNSTLTIGDATGTVTLFIDKDTDVDGSPNPGSRFDIIGILKQFDTTNPYTSGYELQPRFSADVIPGCPGPKFLTTPEATTVDSLGATITWDTDTPSTSFLRYGTTTSYTDSTGDATPTTSHSVTLTGLQPRTLYHFEAKSGDLSATCYTSDRTFVTFPSPGTPGDIALYFNFSVDNSVALPGVPLAQGNVDVQSKLVDLINSAKYSIDCALYSFSLQSVTNALINAKVTRGVQIRLIQDAGNSTAHATQLQGSGIQYITSTAGGNHSLATGGGIMHSKYVVVDARSPDKNDAYVWTGSWNCSVSGQSDCNNTLVIHDYGLAAAYTLDFEQMWGSTTATPNTTNSRMGSRKANITPHSFRVGGIPIEAYMSPSDQTETHLIQNIQQSTHSQHFAILSFTSDALSHAMKVHRDSIPGYVVRGCFEPTEVTSSSEWCRLNGEPACSDYWSPRADVFQDNSAVFSLLHHKYSLLDAFYPNATVMTGSHNYSVAANTVNDENTVVIHDPTIANIYFQEFYKRYRESGGTVGVDPHVAGPAIELAQSRPNPTRGGATLISYSLPQASNHVELGVYDLSGRLVRTLLKGPAAAGTHEAWWDGRNAVGQPGSAGIYFYRLSVDGRTLARKLILTH